jgi:hypothetical protein
MSQDVMDALADAKTLRLFAETAWPDDEGLGLRLWWADGSRGGRMVKAIKRGAYFNAYRMASQLAWAAHQAVPGLLG